LQFDHNYNQVSREVMYNWFNKHLHLGLPEPVVEKAFVPVPPKELSVYDAEHTRPADAGDVKSLRAYLAKASEKQLEALAPKDADGLKEFRRVIGTGLEAIVGDRLPGKKDVEVKEVGEPGEQNGLRWRKYLLSRKEQGEQIPAFGVIGQEYEGTVVIWVHPAGKASLFRDGKLVHAAQQIVDKRAAILAPDVFLTGEFQGAKAPEVDNKYAGFTFGYNRCILANRVHDILTAVAFARNHEQTKRVLLVGFEKAGPWVLIARALCGDAVTHTAVDLDQFRFEKVRETSDEMMLPGALKYGGLPAFAVLCAPGELSMHNTRDTDVGRWLDAVYKAAGSIRHPAEKAAAEQVVLWLLP
jgi:hypothetical protein